VINFDFRKDTEIATLDDPAKEGGITVPAYCQELTELGIARIEHMLYVHRAFGLDLVEAKRICIELEYGSVEAWADEMCEVIDHVESELS
jgi:hypothetical protein